MYSPFYDGVDIVFTADSGYLTTGSAFTSFSASENDLRQPLFAHFSSPFMAPVTLLAMPLSRFKNIYYAIFQSVHLPFVLMTYFIAAKLLKLTGLARQSFILLCSSTYAVMLFVLPIEQYNFAVFYLLYGLRHRLRFSGKAPDPFRRHRHSLDQRRNELRRSPSRSVFSIIPWIFSTKASMFQWP